MSMRLIDATHGVTRDSDVILSTTVTAAVLEVYNVAVV